MGWFSDSKPDEAAIKRELKEARDSLHRIAKRDRDETKAYNDANDRVLRLERELPWWRR